MKAAYNHIWALNVCFPPLNEDSLHQSWTLNLCCSALNEGSLDHIWALNSCCPPFNKGSLHHIWSLNSLKMSRNLVLFMLPSGQHWTENLGAPRAISSCPGQLGLLEFIVRFKLHLSWATALLYATTLVDIIWRNTIIEWSFIFWFKFHLRFFLMVPLTIIQHWFR